MLGLRLPKISFTMLVVAILATTAMLTSTTDTAQGHEVGKHNLALDGSLAHWANGGMDYKFDGTFPSNWKSYINQGAAHMKSGTFAVKLDSSTSSKNKISIGNWPSIFGFLNRRGYGTCASSGSVGGDVACAYPTGSSLTLGTNPWLALNRDDTLDQVAIVFDEADVYQGSGTSRTVRSGWSAAKVRRIAAHEFGHALGFFKHLSGSNDVMTSGSGQYNLSTEDKWNLNRLYMYTTDASACMTEIGLSQSGLKNAKGIMHPASGTATLSVSGTVCPSTAYDDSAAHYFKLNYSGVTGGRRFRVWTESKQDVEQYVHSGSEFDAYKKGEEESPETIGGNKLVQVASGDKDKAHTYQLRITPYCVSGEVYKIWQNTSGASIDGSAVNLGSSDCKSSVTSRGYADFYTIEIPKPSSTTAVTTVTIDLTSDGNKFDPYLYLRRGEDEQSASQVSSDDDSGPGNSARILRQMTPGKYTIEATSHRQGKTGSYTLNITATTTTPSS